MRLAPLFFLAATASAQPATVTGTISDAEGAPLTGASVYLSGTTRGDASDDTGRFEIADVEPGAYRLAASMLGYESAAEVIVMAPGETHLVDLVLPSTPLVLGDVRVEADRDDRWARRLTWFRKALIGESSRADSTHILNPEVLDFRLRWGTLRAEAAAPLVIENRALGYRLTYDLKTFEASSGAVRYDGDERFEPLAPANDREAERWRMARDEAYRGSLAHLLRSLLAGTTPDEGFSFTLTRDDPFGARPSFRVPANGLMRTDADGWGTLRVRGRLTVTYTEREDPAYPRSEWFRERRRRPISTQTSSITVRRGRARIDPQGTPEDPFSVSTSGYLAFERLADRVPEDYRPTVDL